MIRRRDIVATVLLSTVVLTSALAQSYATDVPEIHPGLLMGYLPKEALPNGLALVPPPPPEGSAAFALDEDVARKNLALRGTMRWIQATLDADLSFPNAAGIFSCVLKASVSEERTPHLYLLLRRTLTDTALVTDDVKKYYQRKRPFLLNKESICTPSEQTELAKDGSYPSGHMAAGWAWALILSEIAPTQTNEILARGVAYGESRNVCNVHWYSDVTQGRVIGAAVVAQLHAEAAFRADLEAAKSELATIRTQNPGFEYDCAKETVSLWKNAAKSTIQNIKAAIMQIVRQHLFVH